MFYRPYFTFFRNCSTSHICVFHVRDLLEKWFGVKSNLHKLTQDVVNQPRHEANINIHWNFSQPAKAFIK